MTSKRKLRERIARLEADLFAARQAALSEGLRASRILGEPSRTIAPPWTPEIRTGSFTVRCTCPPDRGDMYAGSCLIHDVQVFS